ncbi:Transmembrane protein 97 [Chytridiales sp. JEL 0842]|nr:Transmembrane protein 97 [Chytridiales sp. JEL 0842]
MPTSVFKRPFDLFLLSTFILHIPITVLVDSQIVLAPYITYPTFASDAVAQYVEMCNDFLVGNPPVWFQAIIWAEIFYQFPFFFYAIWGLITDSPALRIPMIIYASHVLTTLLPIMATFVFSTKMTEQQRYMTVGIYSAWILLPIIYLLRMTVWYKTPSASLKAKKNK